MFKAVNMEHFRNTCEGTLGVTLLTIAWTRMSVGMGLKVVWELSSMVPQHCSHHPDPDLDHRKTAAAPYHQLDMHIYGQVLHSWTLSLRLELEAIENTMQHSKYS